MEQFVLVVMMQSLIVHEIRHEEEDVEESIPIMALRLGVDDSGTLSMNNEDNWVGTNHVWFSIGSMNGNL